MRCANPRINKKVAPSQSLSKYLISDRLKPCHKAVSEQAKQLLTPLAPKHTWFQWFLMPLHLADFTFLKCKWNQKTSQNTTCKPGDDLSISPEHTFFKEGSPKQEILDFAEDINADLVVMGAHTKPNLAGVLLSSTANAVLHHAKQDILVVHTEN